MGYHEAPDHGLKGLRVGGDVDWINGRNENTGPDLVVNARAQLRYVIGGSIGRETSDLAEVVDCVRGVGCTAADAENEEAPVARPRLGEQGYGEIDCCRIEAFEKFGGFVKKLSTEDRRFGHCGD